MNIRSLVTCFGFAFLANYASAMEYNISGHLSSKTLTLDIKETEAVAAGCDLYVQKFIYYPDFKFIDVVLREVKNCPLDNIAARQAQLIWNVPFNFSSEKSIFLKINHRTVGTLLIENQNIVYKPRGN